MYSASKVYRLHDPAGAVMRALREIGGDISTEGNEETRMFVLRRDDAFIRIEMQVSREDPGLLRRIHPSMIPVYRLHVQSDSKNLLDEFMRKLELYMLKGGG